MNSEPESTEDMELEMELDTLFKKLLKGIGEYAELDEQRNLVNSTILPVHKYTVLDRFLSEQENLSLITILNCLPIFLDERTKIFGFKRKIENQPFIESILEIIPKYCPNIDTIDLRSFRISPENKNNFKVFLKQTTSLKSLWVYCTNDNCALSQILLEEDFNLHDQDVQTGLLKIEHIMSFLLNRSNCARLLRLLPNLKSLGSFGGLGDLLATIKDGDDLVDKLNNITEFYDIGTSITKLEIFLKFCPNAKKICLVAPQENVILNLCEFPLLAEIKLLSSNPDFVREVLNLLQNIGRQIKVLIFNVNQQNGFDTDILHDLCPELVKLEFNNNDISNFY